MSDKSDDILSDEDKYEDKSDDSSWSDFSNFSEADEQATPRTDDDTQASVPQKPQLTRTEKKALFRQAVGIPEQEGAYVEKEAPKPMESPPPEPEATPTKKPKVQAKLDSPPKVQEAIPQEVSSPDSPEEGSPSDEEDEDEPVEDEPVESVSSIKTKESLKSVVSSKSSKWEIGTSADQVGALASQMTIGTAQQLINSMERPKGPRRTVARSSMVFKPCKATPLDWSDTRLLLLSDDNIHIDNFPKEIVEEEEDEVLEEEEEEEEDDDEWETEEEEEEMSFEEEEEDEEMSLTPKPSLEDVEGAIPKSILKKLPNSAIRKIIFHARKNILRLETENYLYQNTIDKLEAAERELIPRIPAFTDEEFEDQMKRAQPRICSSSESEDNEPPNDGNYVAVNAFDQIHVSQDSFLENMSDNTKEEAIGFFKAIEGMAPANYDVMHHRYANYVGTAAEKRDFGGEPGVKSRLDPHILNSRMQLDEKMKKASVATVEPASGKDGQSVAANKEEDIDLAVAKKISMTDRFRFAQDEEEEFIKRFYEHDTQALKDESSIQVHIDAHKFAIGILMELRKDFRAIAKGATGVGMNGKAMTDLLVKFRMRMKTQLSVQETRTRVAIRKVMAEKKKTMHQLKINQEIGRGISHVDYECLLCESSILESEMNGMNHTLQHLKELTGQYHSVFQEERQAMSKMGAHEEKTKREVKRLNKLLQTFQTAYDKYEQQITEANLRIDMIEQRISQEPDAPQTSDYIHQKAEQVRLESEIQTLEQKSEKLCDAIGRAQREYEKYSKFFPPGAKTIDEEISDWLAESK